MVTAEISGTVLVGKTPISEVVTLTVSCPKAVGADNKPIT